MQKTFVAGLAIVAVAAAVSTAYAYTLNPDGTGFVGKGEVQIALGYNNKQLQDNAESLVFTAETVTVAETTWTCDRDGGTQTNERENTVTTTTQGIISAVARERNQITGFNLIGFEGDPTTRTAREGPASGSCPTNWTAIDLVVGQPEIVSSGLSVNGVSLD